MKSHSEDVRKDISKALRHLEALIDDMDIPFARKLKGELGEIRRFLTEHRPPRLALVGRRGAGKSSLVNALFGEQVAEVGHEGATTGEGTWWNYEGRLGSIEVLDTRGLQEGSTPEKASRSESAKESILRALAKKQADTVLFLVKATEVDAAIDADIDALEEISDWLEDEYGHQPPIVAVATHCDVLEPKKVELHAPEDFPEQDVEEKRQRVKDITADLKQKLRARRSLRDQLVTAIGVSSYMSWRSDGSLRADDRWQIRELTEFLIDELPDQAKFELARLAQVKFLQRRIASRVVNATSTLCAGIAATPIPVADVAPITAAQVSMVIGVGYLSGRDLDMKGALEFMGAMGVNVGAAWGFRQAARSLVKLLPIAGNAVSAAVAFGGTYALGKAAIAYFIGEADEEEAKEIFHESRDDAADEYDAEAAGTGPSNPSKS